MPAVILGKFRMYSLWRVSSEVFCCIRDMQIYTAGVSTGFRHPFSEIEFIYEAPGCLCVWEN